MEMLNVNKKVRDAITEAGNEMSIKFRNETYQREKNKSAIEDGFTKKMSDAGILEYAMDEDEYFGMDIQKADRAFKKLTNVVCKPSNVLEEIKIYRKYVPWLVNDYRKVVKKNTMLQEALNRIATDSESKKYKKWTNTEDVELIDLVCDKNLSILEVSAVMGRTVPSIKTRVSKLVGLKRLSQDVAGRFIGTIDGNHADCVLDGKIFKK